MSTRDEEPRGWKETTYRKAEEEPDPALRDNPMALVFPAPLADEAVYDVLFMEPPARPDNFKELPLEQRLEFLDRLDEFYNPFPKDADILGAMVSLVRKSFRHRHPKSPAVMYFIMRVAAGIAGSLPRMQPTGGGGALGLLISGPTGTGKSSLLDRIVEHMGRYARYHLSLFGKPCCWPQLGVIRITVGETWKDTLVELLKEIDRQYGRDVLFTRERHATEPRLQHVVWTALCSGFAPCIILDEFQRLGGINQRVAKKILGRLIDLMQDGGIPVFVAGTVAVRRLLEAFPMEMGKFSSGNKFEFERLKEGDRDTVIFITLLKEQQISLSPIEYSADFDQCLVLHSMGVRRIMRDFMRWVFYRHAVAEVEGETIKADRGLLDSIASEQMAAYAKALSALRKFELRFKLSYEELEAYEHFIPNEPEKAKSKAQKVVEALWRAEGEKAVEDDFRLITVDDFVFLRSQIVLRQYEEDAETTHSRRNQSSANNTQFPEAPPKAKLKGRTVAAPKSAPRKGARKSKSASDPPSKVVPLPSISPAPTLPNGGVDPLNLPP